MSADSLTFRVTTYIFDRIRRNQLSSGAKLPSELKTSTELNVSRGVVREAFRALEVAGIIEKENGRSPRVGVLNSSYLTHLMTHALLTKQVSLRQVLELRASIEVKSAELAAQRCTQAEIRKLRAVVRGMKQSVARFNSFVQYDLDFHHLINAATGNPLIEVVCDAMHESIKESIRAGLRKRKGPDEIVKVADAHAAIVDAIEQRNPVKAEASMRKHFDETLLVLDGVTMD